jgi:hypothetical protein
MGIISFFKVKIKKGVKAEIASAGVELTEALELDENNIALLSLFLKPISIYFPTWHEENWSTALGRPLKNTINDFVKRGLITEANSKQKLLFSLRISDMKDLLRTNNLKLSGNKEELAERIMEKLPAECEKMVASKSDIFICTEKGRNIAQEHKTKIEMKRKEAEEKVKDFLKENKVKEAADTVNQFYFSLPGPMIPSGGLWPGGAKMPRNYAYPAEAKLLLKIKSVEGMSKEELEKARLESAVKAIWRGDITGPKPLLSEYHRQASEKKALSDLKSWSGDGFEDISLVTIISNPGACPACQEASEKNYKIEDELKSPTLPIKNCSNEIGYCRCCYAPWDEDWGH